MKRTLVVLSLVVLALAWHIPSATAQLSPQDRWELTVALREAVWPEYPSWEVHHFVRDTVPSGLLGRDRTESWSSAEWSAVFDLWDRINEEWVSDTSMDVWIPLRGASLTPAHRIIAQARHGSGLRGSCYHYTVVVAACVRYLGRPVRIIIERSTLVDYLHIYPQVYVGRSTSGVTQQIQERYPRAYEVNYGVDARGGYWLNLDDGRHPGRALWLPDRFTESVLVLTID